MARSRFSWDTKTGDDLIIYDSREDTFVEIPDQRLRVECLTMANQRETHRILNNAINEDKQRG